MKVVAIYKDLKTDNVVESIEKNFPPEKQQEKKVLKWLKWLKFLKTSHNKQNSTKMVVSIIH